MTIGEQISTARKAKGMTQEELAALMNITRAGVSHWENNRTMPDAETLIRLSNILDHDFTGRESAPSGEADANAPTPPADLPPEAPAEEEPGADSRPASDAPARRSPGRALQILAVALAAAALCAVLVALFLKPSRPAALPAVSDAVDARTVTADFFRQDNPTAQGCAWFALDCVLQVTKNENIDMWMYTLWMHEKNGVAFDIDRIETYTFTRAGVDERIMTASDMSGFGQATHIDAYGDWSIVGGLPVQDGVSGIGFVVRGEDAGGQALSFVCYLPLAA